MIRQQIVKKDNLASGKLQDNIPMCLDQMFVALTFVVCAVNVDLLYLLYENFSTVGSN